MPRFFHLLLILLAPAVSHGGVLSGLTFWRTQQSLAITTAPQSVPAGVCSGVTTVKTKNAAGAFANVTSALTVNLAATGSLTFYSDANCATPITSVTIPVGSGTANFYFMTTAATSETITVTAIKYAQTTQIENGLVNAFVWTGGGADANWSTGANWSGGVAPGAGNQALFNGTCVTNCSPVINSNILVGGIRVASGFSGTITQNAGATITIGSSGWYHSSGAFAGGNSAITLNGPFALSGGTFTNTSATFRLNSTAFAVSNTPTYNHHSGKIEITSPTNPSISGVGSISFYDVDILGNSGSASVTLTGTMNVLGSLRFLDFGYLSSMKGTGTINVSQNLETQGMRWSTSPTIAIRMIGSGTITGSAGSYLGSLEIATSGTITFASTGSIDIGGDFTYTSGTVVSTGSTVRFVGLNQNITPGTVAFNHVSFVGIDIGDMNDTINGTMTVLGDLTLDCSTRWARVNLGTINVSGSLNILGSNFVGGTALIRMIGTGTIAGSGAGSSTGPLEIATSGTMTFATTGSVDIGGNFTYTSGTVVSAGSLIRFTGPNPVTLNAGSVVFENLAFSQGANSANTIIGTVQVNGNLTFNGTTLWPSSNGGTIEVKGDVSATGSWNGGTTSLVLTGTGIQTMSRAGAGYFPGATITVNNASSVLTLGSAVPLNTNQGITITAGSVNMAGYALTAKSLSLNSNTLTKNGGVLTVNGTVVGTGALYGGTVNP